MYQRSPNVCVHMCLSLSGCRRPPTLVLALRPNRSSSSSSRYAPLAAAAGEAAGSTTATDAVAAAAAGAKPASAAGTAADASSRCCGKLLQPLGLGVAAVALPVQVGQLIRHG
jgi:hypothetical protein